jgi:hypothetical protein
MKGLISLLLIFSLNIAFSQVVPTGKDAFTPQKGYVIRQYIDLDYVEGNVGVFYKKSDIGINRGIITRPFIMVEGFDPSGGNTIEDGEVGLYATYAVMFENLRADGWDIIILDLIDNHNRIENNAALMQKLIRDINAEVKLNHDTYGTDIYRPTIMGFSMGGLISRYALAEMEYNGEEHTVDNMICYDSPHRGANVPMGLQTIVPTILTSTTSFYAGAPTWLNQISPLYWAGKLLNETIGFNPILESAAEMSLNSPSNNLARASLLYNFDRIGKYPSKCRNIGIANGTNQIPMAKPYTVDRNLIYWHGGICLFDWRWGGFNMRYCPMGFGMDIYRAPYGAIWPLGAYNYFGFGQDFGLLGASQWVPFFGVGASAILGYASDKDFLNEYRNNYNYDVDLVPGSYLKVFTETLRKKKDFVDNHPLVNTDVPIKIVLPGGCIGRRWWRICWRSITLIDVKIPVKINLLGRLEYKPFTFVPTTSALDVQTSSSDLWNYDVSTLGRYPNGKNTPFDVVAFSNINTNHTDSYPRARMVIHDEISPMNAFIQNKTFDGNYINTFQARNSIILGNNVDYRTDSVKTSQKRIAQGNVIVNGNSNITLVSGNNDFVYFDDGFETGTNFTGEITVKTYTYNQNYQTEMNTISNDKSILNDGYTENTLIVDPKYKTARMSQSVAKTTQNTQANQMDVSKLPDPNIGKFDETAADTKLKQQYEEQTALSKLPSSYVNPNPIVAGSIATVGVKLNTNNTVKVMITDVNGREILSFNYDNLGTGLQTFTIDISSLGGGNYICSIKTNEFTDHHKLIIVN